MFTSATLPPLDTLRKIKALLDQPKEGTVHTKEEVDALWEEYYRLSKVWKALPYGSPEQVKEFHKADEAHERWRKVFLASY